MNLTLISVEKLPGVPRLKLGESPLWDKRTERLYFVDIEQNQLWIYHWSKQQAEVVQAPGRCSYVGLTQNPGVLAIAVEDTVYQFDLTARSWKKSLSVNQSSERWRLNEGFASQDGTLWIGSIDLENGFNGCLWNLDLERREIKRTLNGVGIGNGLVEIDQKIFFTDSRRQGIFEVPSEASDLLNSQPIFSFTSGEPDGCLLSEAGEVWSAIWGGACLEIRNFQNPSVKTISVPFKQPTSLEQISPNTLIITSASVGLADCGHLDGHVVRAQVEDAVLFRAKNYLRVS
ncbi:MAG: SMP-30/gluconolactonase/LRE family protein [Pseudobdellovibrionaceae bacterium]